MVGISTQEQLFESDEYTDGYPPNETAAVTSYVMEHTQEDDYVVVWGMQSQINVNSGRMLVLPAVNDCVIYHPDWTPALPDHYARVQERFMDDLVTLSPAIFIVGHNDSDQIKKLTSDESLRFVPGLEAYLASHYEVGPTIGRYVVHQLRREPID